MRQILGLSDRSVPRDAPSLDELAERHFRRLERGISGGVLHVGYDGTKGDLFFYSHAFYDYLQRVGDSTQTRNSFSAVAEQPASRNPDSSDYRYSRMGKAVNNFAKSRTIVSQSVRGVMRGVNDVIFGYLLGSNSPVRLYAAEGHSLSTETLQHSPYVSINLKVR